MGGGPVYPRASIADIEMISISFCRKFRSRFVGDTVTKDSLWALETPILIGKRFPVCNVAVGLLRSRVLARQ
jgi:hypothetical protein